MLFPDEKNPVPAKRKPARAIRPGKPKPSPTTSEIPVKKKSKKER